MTHDDVFNDSGYTPDLPGTPLDELQGWGAQTQQPAERSLEERIIADPLYVPTPRWWARSLEVDRQQDLAYIVTFTEWILAVWRWEKKLIPPCWIKHPDLVVEMQALAMAHHSMHTPDNHAGPVQWLLYLDHQKRRLEANSSAAGCAERGSHELFGSTPAVTTDRLRHYGEGDDTTPELPISVAAWTWPHHHPDPAMNTVRTTNEKEGQS